MTFKRMIGKLMVVAAEEDFLGALGIRNVCTTGVTLWVYLRMVNTEIDTTRYRIDEREKEIDSKIMTRKVKKMVLEFKRESFRAMSDLERRVGVIEKDVK